MGTGGESWIGHRVGGRYKLAHLIGRTDHGVLFGAFDEKSRQRVVVELLPPALATAAGGVDALRELAEQRDILGHRTIARTLAIELREGEPLAVVLEPMVGQLLGQLLRQEGSLPQARISAVALQVLSALHAAHSVSMIHGDVGPNSILLLEGGGDAIKLLDFGFSPARPPAYVTPEQTSGEPVDARSDLYQLGVLMFQASTGRMPFDAPGATTLVELLRDTPAPSLSSVLPEADIRIDGAIAGALHVSKDARFQTANDMRATVARKPRRNPTLVGLGDRDTRWDDEATRPGELEELRELAKEAEAPSPLQSVAEEEEDIEVDVDLDLDEPPPEEAETTVFVAPELSDPPPASSMGETLPDAETRRVAPPVGPAAGTTEDTLPDAPADVETERTARPARPRQGLRRSQRQIPTQELSAVDIHGSMPGKDPAPSRWKSRLGLALGALVLAGAAAGGGWWIRSGEPPWAALGIGSSLGPPATAGAQGPAADAGSTPEAVLPLDAGPEPSADALPAPDTGAGDAGARDAGPRDASAHDAARPDGGGSPQAAGDASETDAGVELPEVPPEIARLPDRRRAVAARQMRGRGHRLVSERRYRQAELVFRKALQYAPESGLAARGLAHALAGSNQLEQAEAWARRAVTLRPDDPAAHVLLGDLLDRRGEREAAIGHWEKARRLDHDNRAAIRRLRRVRHR